MNTEPRILGEVGPYIVIAAPKQSGVVLVHTYENSGTPRKTVPPQFLTRDEVQQLIDLLIQADDILEQHGVGDWKGSACAEGRTAGVDTGLVYQL